MTDSSTTTTGGDPVSGVDPGGTRPAHGRRSEKGGEQTTRQEVASGDRNTQTRSGVIPDLDPGAQQTDESAG